MKRFGGSNYAILRRLCLVMIVLATVGGMRPPAAVSQTLSDQVVATVLNALSVNPNASAAELVPTVSALFVGANCAQAASVTAALTSSATDPRLGNFMNARLAIDQVRQDFQAFCANAIVGAPGGPGGPTIGPPPASSGGGGSDYQ